MHGIVATPSFNPLDAGGAGPETSYAQFASAEHRRRHGQFFTPPRLAALMADWAMSTSPRTVLDPAYGTGILTAACLALDPAALITAFERDQMVLGHAREKSGSVDVRHADFLSWAVPGRYDAIIMNPPYVRHREISGYAQERLEIARLSGCTIPKSANLYIYFALKALSLLESGGRAAILIPAEWMNANFSKSFKEHILKRQFLRKMVVFSNCSNVFDDALTTASVLLCEK